MASTWPGSVCQYCGAAESVRYECPSCKRSACPTCMPDGEEEKCPYCQTNLYTYENELVQFADI